MKYSSISILLALIITVLLVAGCGQSGPNNPASPPGTTTSTTPPQSPVSSSPTAITVSSQTPTPVGVGVTEWKSKMLASNLVFGPSVAATIDGKDYLIYGVNFGTNPDGTGTNADVGIIILDISNPDNPNEIAYLKNGTDETHPYIRSLKLGGSTLYSLTGSYLLIIDVSDPFHPKELGKTPLNAPIDIAIAGQYAFVITSDDKTISTLDISDPVQPRIIGETALPGYLIVLKTDGPLLLALAYNGLYVLDTSVSANLKEIGLLANPYPTPTGLIAPEHIPPDFFAMALAGNYVYIPAGIDRLVVVDISDPSKPQITTDFGMQEQGTEIIIGGNLAYLLASNGAIQFSMNLANTLAIFDISNPGKLLELTPVRLPQTFPDSYQDLIEAKNRLYMSDNRNPVILIKDLSS